MEIAFADEEGLSTENANKGGCKNERSETECNPW